MQELHRVINEVAMRRESEEMARLAAGPVFVDTTERAHTYVGTATTIQREETPSAEEIAESEAEMAHKKRVSDAFNRGIRLRPLEQSAGHRRRKSMIR